MNGYEVEGMRRNGKIRIIAIMMAFIILFTSSNYAAALENETSVLDEISDFAEADQGVLDKDEVSYAMDGDAFLNMLLNAQKQSPIQNLSEVFGYESEELNTKLLKENTELFLVGEPMVQEEYRVFTFLQKDLSGFLNVLFFTENISQNEMNAELNVDVECLEAVSINEVLEYSTTDDLTEQPVMEEPVAKQPITEEPTIATDSAIRILSMDESLDVLKEAIQEEATVDKVGEVEKVGEAEEETEAVEEAEKSGEVGETEEVIEPEKADEARESEKVEEVGETEKLSEEAGKAGKPEKAEEVGEVAEAEEEKTEENLEDLKSPVLRTALVSVFCVSNTEIAPTINKKAVKDDLVSNCNESVDYNITLTVNGASKVSTTVTTQLADVIFVLDISNSMNDRMGNDTRWGKLKTAMNGMVTALLPQNSQNRISIVAYGGSKDKNNSDYKILLSKSSNENTVKNSYNKSLSEMRIGVFGSNDWNGGTNSKAGFVGALKELQNLGSDSQNRNKYVIYMSDGVPTYFKEYLGEYNNGEFSYICSYDSIGYCGGNGYSYYSQVAKQAINVARRINWDFPDTVIYTVGIGATATYSQYLLNTDNFENGGFNKIYKSADNASDLETVFKELTQTVNHSIPLTNITAQDKLSKYVALYEESDIIVNGVSIQPTINHENENRIDYIQNGTVVATYDKETKMIDWQVADSLGENKISTLTYSVHTTEAAIAYEDGYKGKEDCYQGSEDSGTHACNAPGSSEEEQYGYRSNEYATVTYRDENQIGTLTFNHPVVQSTVKGTLKITKQLDRQYAGLSSDTWYHFDVTLESRKLTEELMKNLKFTTTGQYTTPVFYNGKVTFTVKLKATESMLICNLPVDTQYTVSEDTTTFDNPYYEIGGVNITGTEGSEYQVNQTTVTGTLEKTGILGKEKYNLISYEKKDGSKRWYNADTMKEIVDSDLLSKLIENAKLIEESDFTLGKEVAGIWKGGIDPADLNCYKDSNGKSVWARNVVENEYKLNAGEKKTVYINEEGEQVSPKSTRDVYYYSFPLFYKIYEYQTENGQWRDCYYDWYGNCYDLENNDEVTSSDIKEKIEGKVDGRWITVRQIQKTSPSYYLYKDTKYETKEALRSALIDSTSNYYVTYDSGTTVIFITYDCSYASDTEYLKAEKGYYEAKVATYDSFVENFSFTGAKTELNFVNSMVQILGDITVNKTLVKADEVDTNTFIFRLENTDVNSPAHGMVAYKSVSLASGTLSGQITFENLPMGIYTITEEENMNYNKKSITNNGIISLEKTNTTQSVDVLNVKVLSGGFSDSSVAVNKGIQKDNIISYEKLLTSLFCKTKGEV